MKLLKHEDFFYDSNLNNYIYGIDVLRFKTKLSKNKLEKVQRNFSRMYNLFNLLCCRNMDRNNGSYKNIIPRGKCWIDHYGPF